MFPEKESLIILIVWMYFIKKQWNEDNFRVTNKIFILFNWNFNKMSLKEDDSHYITPHEFNILV